MFLVYCVSPLDFDWEDRDRRIREVAGRKVGVFSAGNGTVEHSWYLKNFEDAVELKKRLSDIELSHTSIREV